MSLGKFEYRGCKRYPELLGVKRFEVGHQVCCERSGLNPEYAVETNGLEYGRGRGNSRRSGEMHRYREEHQWRKHSAGPTLTLTNES